jgi:hypothetical protein
MLSTATALQMRYLLLCPLPSGFQTGQPIVANKPKDAPYFFDLEIELADGGQETIQIAETTVKIQIQVLDRQVWLADCRYALTDAFGSAAFTRKCQIQNELKAHYLAKLAETTNLVEEYTIVLMQHTDESPDAFVNAYGLALARLLRSHDRPLTFSEAQDTLISRISYSPHDLTIVDWDGAVIIDSEGDFDSDIELIKIGNFQLLRYRLLDAAIERSLQALQKHLKRGRRWLPNLDNTLRSILQQRITLLFDFEATDQSLLLIGDWYSAKIYRMIVDEFYLDDWHTAISHKLDNLESITEIVRQELTFSWNQLFDILEILGYFVLLIGYFLLFFVESGWLDLKH